MTGREKSRHSTPAILLLDSIEKDLPQAERAGAAARSAFVDGFAFFYPGSHDDPGQDRKLGLARRVSLV